MMDNTMEFFYWLRLQFYRMDIIGGLARMLISTPGAPTTPEELDNFESFLKEDSPYSKTLIALDEARKEYHNVV
jgi:hypothetical protein